MAASLGLPAELLLISTCLCSVTRQLSDTVKFRANLSPLDVSSLTSKLPGEQRLICPTEPIQATEGARVILQCPLDPPLDLTARTVNVRRPDIQDKENVVLSYRHGRDYLDPQMSEYRNRTTLDHKDLARGIITVRISSVNVSDSGPYRFYISKLKTGFDIYLNVESKRFDSIPTRPPVEDVTESEHRGETVADWMFVVPIVVVVVVVVVGGALQLHLLVKRGVIRKCWQRLRGRRDEEANTTNDFEVDHLKTSSADDNNNPDACGENGNASVLSNHQPIT